MNKNSRAFIQKTLTNVQRIWRGVYLHTNGIPANDSSRELQARATLLKPGPHKERWERWRCQRNIMLGCPWLSGAGAGNGGIARDLSVINRVPGACPSSWLIHYW